LAQTLAQDVQESSEK